MRSLYQSHLQTLGIYVHKNAGKILFVAIIVLSAFCVLLKTATIHSKIHQLWIQGKYICKSNLFIEIECVSLNKLKNNYRGRTIGTRIGIYTENVR